MDKTNLKSLIKVSEDLMFIADKLKEVAETLDAIVGSEEKIARDEAKKKPATKVKTVKEKATPKAKTAKKPKKVEITKEEKKTAPVVKKDTVTEKPAPKKRGRPAKVK